MKLFLTLITHFLLGQCHALLLNEVMCNPAGSEYEDEFIEIIQNDSTAIWLEGWQISDGSGQDLLLFRRDARMLEAGEIALILDPDRPRECDSLFADCLLLEVDDSSLGSGGLSNSQAEAICLISPDGLCVDQVTTRPELAEDSSLERRQPLPHCDDCWLEGRHAGGTPGLVNSRAQRDQELEAWIDEDGLRLKASGSSGFRGSAFLQTGSGNCLGQTEHLLEMGVGEFGLLDFEPLPMAGSCSLRVAWQALDGSTGLALDTLLARAATGMLSLEVINLEQPQWIQLRSRSACPLLLNGMTLRWRSAEVELQGLLPAGGSCLLASPELLPACPPQIISFVSLSIGLSEGIDLLDVDGSLLDQARWPEGERGCWLRRSGQPDGGNPDSWQESHLQAGCEPVRAAAYQGSAGFELNTRCPEMNESLCVAQVAGHLRMELWSLSGQLLASREGHQNCCLPSAQSLKLGAGLYLLRVKLENAGAELVPVAIKP